MNYLTARILLLDPVSATLYSFIFTALGGLIGSQILTVRRRLGREQFFWSYCVLLFVVGLSSVAAFGFPAAAEAGMPWLLILFDVGVSVVFGIVLYEISAARSNDGWGRPDRAWIGFVPVVILWLLLKPSAPAAGVESRSRTRFVRLVRDPALVIGAAVIVIFSGNLVPTLIQDPLSRSLSGSDAFQDWVQSAMTVEEKLAVHGADLQSRVSEEIADGITLEASEVDGTTLRLHFHLETSVARRSDIRALIASELCSPDRYAEELAFGVTIVAAYYGLGGFLGDFEITEDDCPG